MLLQVLFYQVLKSAYMKAYEVRKESGLVLYVKAGRNYGIFESMVPDGSQKAQRVSFTAMPLTDGINEIILK